jgi:vacuolar protein sorting-associated protein 52
LTSNESTTSFTGTSRASNGVGSKAGSSRQRPPEVTDPLEVLNGIIGNAKTKDLSAESVNTARATIEKPAQLIETINFEGSSLEEFALKDKESSRIRKVDIGAQTVHQCGSCQAMGVL